MPTATGATALESFPVLGVPVTITNLDQACATIEAWSRDRLGRFVCIRDVHGVMQAQDNPDLMALHHEAAMVTPDGMPLVWLGKRGGHAVERTSGADLMDRVMSRSPASGLKHFLLGGKPGVADALRNAFSSRYPGTRFVGAMTPAFGPIEEGDRSAMREAILASGADVVWVGLSTPKQEFLMRELARDVPATLIGVGAAFDFHTGAVKRAPLWMQRSGLEWLHRLGSEPRRLWRRYLIMAPRFVWLVLRDGAR